MNLIFKHILKNIREHKFRTIISILAISVACALVFVAMSISDTMVKIYEHSLRKFCGESDIKISYEENEEGYFSPLDLSVVSDQIEVNVEYIQKNGFYHQSNLNDVNIVLVATDMEEYLKINTVGISQGNDDIGENQVIIGKTLAEEYDLSVGDITSLFIDGMDIDYEIVGIAEDSGLFYDDGINTVMLTSFENINSNYNLEGKINAQYIMLNDGVEINEVISTLSEKYEDYDIVEAISKESSQETIKLITVVFTIVAVIVIILALYINISTFKTIMLERLPVLGTFRSLGADKKIVNSIIMCESGLEGVIGGALGSLFGIGLLNLVANLVKDSWGGAEGKVVVYGFINIIATFLVAIVISILSALKGIRKTRKYTIKELIFNNNEDKIDSFSIKRLIICLVLLAFTLIAPYFVTGMAAAVVDGINIVILIALIPLMIPYFTRLFVIIMYVIGNNFGLSSLSVASKNLKDDKSVRSDVVMIAIGVAALLMISTIGNDVINATIDTFGDSNYQITFSVVESNDETETKLKETPGVSDIYGIYEQLNVKVDGTSTSISYLDGVHPERYADYFNMRYYNDDQDAIMKLKNGGGIILNRTFKGLIGAEIGDKVTLVTGNDSTAEYTVVAFMDTLWVGGSYAMISADDMKKDFDREYYDAYWVRTSIDADEGVKKLQQTFSDCTTVISTTESVRDNIVNAHAIMFKVVNAFSGIAIFICIIGVFNSVLLSFLKRKKTFALYRSLGMSQQQLKTMSFIEVICTGLFGGVVGILFGNLLIRETAFLLSEMMATVEMNYSIKTSLIYVIVPVIIMILSSISVMVKIAKTNIIETLKYE